MTYTSSSLDGTPALIHSSTTLPVSREENDQIGSNKRDDKTEERVGASKEDQVVADAGDAKTRPTEQGEKDSDSWTTKSEPSLVAHQTTENVSEIEEKNVSKQAIPSDPTISEKLIKNPLHSEVSRVKSEPSLVHQSANIDSNVEAEEMAGDMVEKPTCENFPKHSEVSPSGHATPLLHAVTTPPAQIDQSALTSPKSDVGEEGRVDNLQPVSGEDEKSKELAPFPQLETLSLVNNLVCKF